MAKKDTSDTIRAMLGERGQTYRPSADVDQAAPTAPEEPQRAEDAPAPTVVELRSVSTSPRARRARSEAVHPSEERMDNAPRTLRLSQPMANALRDAWLTAKRDDVLLTYQDFADRIVRAGLKAPGNE